MHIGDVIKQYRLNHGLSMDEFALRSSLSKAYISILENNVNPSTGVPATPSLKTIKLVAGAIGVDFEILLASIDPETQIELNNSSPRDLAHHGFVPVIKRKIPVLGNVHCGEPSYAEEELLDVVESDIKADFALRCIGDSMSGAGISNGDYVFVRKQVSVSNGEIAVVLLEGQDAAIKRIYKSNNYIKLLADNPDYDPIIFTEAEVDNHSVQILGKVVAHLHFYPKRKETVRLNQ